MRYFLLRQMMNTAMRELNPMVVKISPSRARLKRLTTVAASKQLPEEAGELRAQSTVTEQATPSETTGSKTQEEKTQLQTGSDGADGQKAKPKESSYSWQIMIGFLTALAGFSIDEASQKRGAVAKELASIKEALEKLKQKEHELIKECSRFGRISLLDRDPEGWVPLQVEKFSMHVTDVAKLVEQLSVRMENADADRKQKSSFLLWNDGTLVPIMFNEMDRQITRTRKDISNLKERLQMWKELAHAHLYARLDKCEDALSIIKENIAEDAIVAEANGELSLKIIEVSKERKELLAEKTFSELKSQFFLLRAMIYVKNLYDDKKPRGKFEKVRLCYQESDIPVVTELDEKIIYLLISYPEALNSDQGDSKVAKALGTSCPKPVRKVEAYWLEKNCRKKMSLAEKFGLELFELSHFGYFLLDKNANPDRTPREIDNQDIVKAIQELFGCVFPDTRLLSMHAYNQACGLDPNNYMAKIYLGATLFAREDWYAIHASQKDGAALVNEAIKIFPNFSLGYNNLADILMRQGPNHLSEALKLIDIAIILLNPKAVSGDSAFSEEIQLRKNNKMPLFMLTKAQILLRLGQEEEAIRIVSNLSAADFHRLRHYGKALAEFFTEDKKPQWLEILNKNLSATVYNTIFRENWRAPFFKVCDKAADYIAEQSRVKAAKLV